MMDGRGQKTGDARTKSAHNRKTSNNSLSMTIAKAPPQTIPNQLFPLDQHRLHSCTLAANHSSFLKLDNMNGNFYPATNIVEQLWACAY